MSKPISITKLSDTLQLSEFRDGFWLWDETRQMNLARREKTERAAMVRAIKYYQDMLILADARHRALHEAVGGFVNKLRDTNNDEFNLVAEEY